MFPSPAFAQFSLPLVFFFTIGMTSKICLSKNMGFTLGCETTPSNRHRQNYFIRLGEQQINNILSIEAFKSCYSNQQFLYFFSALKVKFMVMKSVGFSKKTCSFRSNESNGESNGHPDLSEQVLVINRPRSRQQLWLCRYGIVGTGKLARKQFC